MVEYDGAGLLAYMPTAGDDKSATMRIAMHNQTENQV